MSPEFSWGSDAEQPAFVEPPPAPVEKKSVPPPPPPAIRELTSPSKGEKRKFLVSMTNVPDLIVHALDSSEALRCALVHHGLGAPRPASVKPVE